MTPSYSELRLVFYSALMGAGDAHILPVLGDGAASDLNALRLQDAGELLVGERTAGVFFVDKFFDAAFQDQQRCVAALGALHALAEEVAQFEHTLRGVGIF